MVIKKIKGNTFCIDTGMTYIPFYKINNKEIIMLDSGLAGEETEGIEKLLERHNLKLAAIICSHAHVDHVGNNAYFKEKYNCIIAMPEYEAFICSSIDNLKFYYGYQTLSDLKENFGNMVCKTDVMILDNQDYICVYGIKFKIIHTPGHSPAHICIVTPDDVVYLGDSLISYEVMEGAKMPYTYTISKDLKSKTKLYNFKYEKYIVAHKGIYSNITKLIEDNVNFYRNIAAKIYNVINGSITMETIVKSVIENFDISISGICKYIIMERIVRSYVEYLDEMKMIKLNIEDGFIKYSKVL
ncbi:MBL fold metallo-hydrolase [Clostridium sp. BJN0013]|uniref:MBL fold metallo-hydrolase n=1 Tax=Clostridium sp. BJN0013 TaxID=3236840 RepID=UPI0034C64BDB